MALADLRARFDAIPTSEGTQANRVKAILMEAAVKIGDIVEDDTVTSDIAQHLEKGAHRAAARLGDQPEERQEDAEASDTEDSRETTGT
jgi:hypothetical protein